MAIYAFGAYYDSDMSEIFRSMSIVGVGWSENDAPDLHCIVRQIKVGDLVYIKSFSPASENIIVKGIGIISDSTIRTGADTNNMAAIGRNVNWVVTEPFDIPKPNGKSNVRSNTVYEECHPTVQAKIIQKLIE